MASPTNHRMPPRAFITADAYRLAAHAREYIVYHNNPIYGRVYSFDDGGYALFIQEFLDARISPTPHIPDITVPTNSGGENVDP